MRILITGGSGTVGQAFMQRYYDVYDFYIISRNEKLQHDTKTKFPKVNCFLGNVENREQLFSIYEKTNPNVVIHAAAVKHINLAESQPNHTCDVNVVGSLNVIDASIAYNIPITVGISTDKACDQSSVYGSTKYLMERCFLEANKPTTKFAIARFANVAHSNGSVIPMWLQAAKNKEKLRITNPEMSRMMFSQKEAAELIGKTLELCNEDGGFILTKLIKTVNILDLAKNISDNYEIIGARDGEKIHESLISIAEVPYTEVLKDYFIRINSYISNNPLPHEYNTMTAPKMSDKEIIALITTSN